MQHRESNLQQRCVLWFRYQWPQYRLLLFAVPNGGFRIAREAARLYAEGVTPGVSDLILLAPRGQWPALCIELKTTAPGSRQSARQREWQVAVEAEGYRYEIVRTLDEFIALINDYLAQAAKTPQIRAIEF